MRALIATVVLGGVYFAAGKLGLSLAFVNVSATAVWPPTGIAIAALILFGPRLWPGVLLGAFAVNLSTSGSAVSSLGIAIGNTLEALIAARLVTTYANGRRAFERPQDVFRFAVLAALLSTVVSATVGVSTLCLTGQAGWGDFGAIWFTWWLGDTAGALIVTPAILLWATPAADVERRANPVEAFVLLLAIVASGLIIFGGLGPLSVQRYPTAFLTFPTLVWAAYRFGPRGAATAIVVMAAVAIGGTVRGFGAFARNEPNEALLLVQSFLGVASVTTIALAAAVLERARADATIRVTQERLRLAEERKVAARDEFLAVAAHELKTPLTSLRLSVEHLRHQVERGAVVGQSELGRSLRTIEDQSLRLARLVTKLLETVRLQEDRLVLERAPTDLARVVADAVERARAVTHRHDIVLSAPDRLDADVDPLRIEEVLTNLLDNAIKFSPDGGRIDIELARDADDTVRLAVRDHGVGVSNEQRPLLFERFRPGNDATQPSGLGLGLYLCRQIVERHGGSITADFPSDGGTRFVVRLPIVRVGPRALDLPRTG